MGKTNRKRREKGPEVEIDGDFSLQKNREKEEGIDIAGT